MTLTCDMPLTMLPHSSLPHSPPTLTLPPPPPPTPFTAEYMAYMLKYDSVHGVFKHEIHGEGNTLYIDGRAIAINAHL